MKKITSSIFLLALILTPVLGYAKENEKRGDNDDDKDNKEHVFSLKDLSKFDWKNWNHNKATSTVDVTYPVINSFTVKIKNKNKATVKWTTNEKSKAVLFYGTTTPIVVKSTTSTRGNILESVSSTNSVAKVDNTFLSMKGQIDVKNLLASTTYYAILAVRDSSGNVTISNTVTFTTNGSINPSDVTAPVISNIMTTIGLNKLLIGWKTNEPSTSKMFYSTTTLNIAATSTANMSNATLKTNHSFELPILASTTPYKVILQATDAVGNVQTSAEYSIFSPF